MKVGFFIWALTPAGAERVLSILANAWAERGWEIVVFTMDGPAARSFYPLAPSVKVRHLDLLKSSGSVASALTNNLTRVRTLRSALQHAKPDVLISFIDQSNVIALLASRGLDLPVIISERTDPSRRSIGRLWDGLRRLTYPWTDGIVFQSQAVADWFPTKIAQRGMIIPNPVPAPPAPSDIASAARERPCVVSMGRLVPVKGFDVLLTAFALASKRVPGWCLEIWGEGDERERLTGQTRELGIEADVRFPGITQRPTEVLRAADLFVMSSHAEGFPNALVEAMACGLPVISTRFGGAAEDIVQDGSNGLLVPPANAPALAAAMERLMADPIERARLSSHAPEVIQRFSIDRVLALWDEALSEALARRSRRPSPPEK